MVELDRRGPEGQGNIPAEAGVPPEAGGEEQPVRGEGIGVALPVHPIPGAVSRADQRRTPVAPADRRPAIPRSPRRRSSPTSPGSRVFPARPGRRRPAARCGVRRAGARAAPGGARCRPRRPMAPCRARCRRRSWWAARHRGGRPGRRRCTSRSGRRRAGRGRAGESRCGYGRASRRPPGRRRVPASPRRPPRRRLPRSLPAWPRRPAPRRAAPAADARRFRRQIRGAAVARGKGTSPVGSVSGAAAMNSR